MIESEYFDSPIIAIDFDDTIVISDYPEIIGFKPGAKKAIKKLKDAGCRIVIWTCRTDTDKVEEFLIKNNVPFDAINDNSAITDEEWKRTGFEDTRKIGADLVIDDRAIEFKDNWNEITKRLIGGSCNG